MSIQNVPVTPLPYLYISGMNIAVASSLIISIAPGAARDNNDILDIVFNNAFYINAQVNGAGGLDIGSPAVNQKYVVYLIADSSNKLPPSALLTLYSNVSPLVPLGYDSRRLLGFVQTNGSALFTQATVLNASSSKSYYLQPEISVASGVNSTTFATVNLSSAVPTTTAPFVIVKLDILFTPAAAGDFASFRPTGSGATSNLPVVTGIAAGVPQRQFITMITGIGSSVPEIDYLVSSSADSLSILVNAYAVSLS